MEEKEAINLKENKGELMGGLEERNGREEMM